MTRLLLLILAIAVLLAPAGGSTAFESPLLFESPVWDGSDGVITAQLEAHTYLLPTIRVGDHTE